MKENEEAAGLRSGILILLGPVLALVALATLTALLAGLFGWHTAEMLPIAAGLGVAALLASILTLYLLYRQRAQHSHDIRARRIAERRVSGILDSAMDAIIAVDENQRVVLYNDAAEKVFQWPRGEVMGDPLEKLIPARFRAKHQDHMRRFGETGATARRMGDQTVLSGLRADGTEFPIEASISHHAEAGRKIYTVILRDITERMQALHALSRSRQELREFAEAASSVREQEKSRIARELHDELGQALTAMKMDLNWLSERMPANETAMNAKLAAMQSMLDETVASTRRISADLRPLMLDDLGLLPALEWLVQNFTERSGVACELNILVPELDLREPYATAVFRILQEALTNAARHARATMVEVTVGLQDGAVNLAVDDDGQGFALDGPRKPNSFGLMGLRERVYLLNGEVNIDSAPGAGTHIKVRIPLQEPQAAPGAAREVVS